MRPHPAWCSDSHSKVWHQECASSLFCQYLGIPYQRWQKKKFLIAWSVLNRKIENYEYVHSLHEHWKCVHTKVLHFIRCGSIACNHTGSGTQKTASEVWGPLHEWLLSHLSNLVSWPLQLICMSTELQYWRAVIYMWQYMVHYCQASMTSSTLRILRTWFPTNIPP